MAATTQFIVQVFKLGKRGQLQPDTPVIASSAANAAMRAERLSATAAGVIAYEMTVDADVGDYGEPRVLARFGQVPEEMA